MKVQILALPSLLLSLAVLSGCQTSQHLLQTSSSDSSEARQINNVYWNKSGTSFKVPDNSHLAENQNRIVFFRLADSVKNINEDYQTSINIGIDGRFQTSLQPGQSSQAIVCTGEHLLSTEVTGAKNNFLNNTSLIQTLNAQGTYYYQVAIDQQTQKAVINAVNEKTAIELLQNSPKQNHQISRVVAQTCQPIVEPVVEAASEAIVIDEPIELDVLFEFDSAKFISNYHQKLDDVAQFMKKHPDVHAALEGHTDSMGSEVYNQALSQQRVDAVKNMLVNQYGIDSSRLSAHGFGESQPIDSNATEEGRQNNRRVVAVISPASH